MAQKKGTKSATKTGAKGKYQEWLTKDGLTRLEAWARDGLTDEQIAGKIGIVPSTLYEWKNKHSEISDALKKGKEVVDIEVENALLKRAMGYKYTETTSEQVKNPETGEYELVVTRAVTKEVVPDTTAQIFWLKNRKPAEWRDKREVETNVSGKLSFLSGLSNEELEKLAEGEE